MMIADDQKALAIAGIMGGVESAISEKTTSIILESACFEASSIRRGSSSLHLRTDASVRFEKGLDQQLTEQALNKIVELVLDICPKARVVSTVIDVRSVVQKKDAISVPYSLFEKKLGIVISKKIIISILERLGFVVVDKKDVPAIGAAIGVDRVVEAPWYSGLTPRILKKPKICFIQLGSDAKLKSLNVIEILRKAHIPIHHTLAKDSLSTQLASAEKIGCPYAIIFGQKEALEDSVLVRDMKTRSQETVKIKDLAHYIKEL
jgi:hypothetical protein